MTTLSQPVVYLFPGQGSQALGMGRNLAQTYPAAMEVFAQADEILGFSLSRMAWEGPEEALNDTINTQPTLMVHSAAVLRVLHDLIPTLQPVYVAGHSMGELSALVAANALPFSDALRLVRIRGELMKRAGEESPGGMAAILGLDVPTLEAICSEASRGFEAVQVANDNCPGQVVISGAAPALERALQLALSAGARRAVPLAVSIAAHSLLMSPVQGAFNQAVAAARLSDPSMPIIGNVSGQPMGSADEIRADLQAQLTSPVRWTESIRFMISTGVKTFLELGSGTVLTGLLKRIDREAIGISVGTPEDFEKLAV